MQVDPSVEFAIVWGAALLFSVLALMDRSDVEDPDIPTYYALLIRRPIFAFAAFYLWVIEGGMGTALTTAPNVADPYASIFGLLGTIFGTVFFILSWFFVLIAAYTLIRVGYVGKRKPPPEVGVPTQG